MIFGFLDRFVVFNFLDWFAIFIWIGLDLNTPTIFSFEDYQILSLRYEDFHNASFCDDDYHKPFFHPRITICWHFVLRISIMHIIVTRIIVTHFFIWGLPDFVTSSEDCQMLSLCYVRIQNPPLYYVRICNLLLIMRIVGYYSFYENPKPTTMLHENLWLVFWIQGLLDVISFVLWESIIHHYVTWESVTYFLNMRFTGCYLIHSVRIQNPPLCYMRIYNLLFESEDYRMLFGLFCENPEPTIVLHENS